MRFVAVNAQCKIDLQTIEIYICLDLVQVNSR